MTTPPRRRRRRAGTRPRLALAAVTFLLWAGGSGCQSGGVGPIARWRMASDATLAKAPEGLERKGLLGRWISPRAPKSSASEVGDAMVLGSDGWSPLKPPKDPEAEAELAAAEALFNQGKFAEAESAYAAIAKRRKETPWGEKAQFFLAESQYQQGQYVAADTSFEELIATYPGTVFLEQAVAREYSIADAWLTALDPKAKPEDQLSLRKKVDGRFPAVDTAGHALAAMEHVRHHDPTGPLADDAVKRIADYHYAREHFEDAAVYYDQLVSEHPKSDFVEKAQLASIDSKLRAYLGPEYDGAGLEQARNQVVQTMAAFPERQAGGSDEMTKILETIDEQMAERAFQTGEHYLWTGKVASAEFCFGEIPVKWPKSPYARLAKQKLAHIATLPRKETKASTIMSLPGSSDPLTGSQGANAGGFAPSGGGMSGAGGMGGMGGMTGP
jgi:outer membrane protein assembly factor BamD (BamD/ComL family)